MAEGAQANVRTLSGAVVAMLQGQPRHPARKHRIHTADSTVLDRKIKPCERDCLNQFLAVAALVL